MESQYRDYYIIKGYDAIDTDNDQLMLEEMIIDEERPLSVNDPAINFSRIYRELKRLEGHLTDEWMYCPSCMYKHVNTALDSIGESLYSHATDALDLAHEAYTLDDDQRLILMTREVIRILSPLPRRFAEVVRRKKKLSEREKGAILQQVRHVRRMITHMAMDDDLRRPIPYS